MSAGIPYQGRKAHSLFITYDGLLDPLGASQILPYLRAIASKEERLHILSFEKKQRFAHSAQAMRSQLEGTTINWNPLLFTSSWGILGKLWDLLRMYAAAMAIAAKLRPSVVHARSHAPAQVGLLIKQLFGARLLFDFRGLWADERIDKGGWRLSNPWHRLQYRHYKRVEHRLLAKSDHVVVLTEAVVSEVLHLGVTNRDRLTVIPCCADFSHFKLATPVTRQLARGYFKIPQDSLVLGYLGSVGGMYTPERFLQLVDLAAARFPNLQVLVLTPDLEAFLELMRLKLPSRFWPRIQTRSANRDQVARWVPAMDVLVAFTRTSYARISMSPTKLAEVWASGIPALCNSGVGDVAQLVAELDAGMVINIDSDQELQNAAKALPSLVTKGGKRLRDAAQAKLSLALAADRYLGIYRLLRS